MVLTHYPLEIRVARPPRPAASLDELNKPEDRHGIVASERLVTAYGAEDLSTGDPLDGHGEPETLKSEQRRDNSIARCSNRLHAALAAQLLFSIVG